ncbi:MAG: succinate dehydrogenase/fumarate reductase iron-sulfur subunit [bacterium]|nr:succinate dehydrogenase/fumarate reductase iron-sulfur subunit [bacterium]
MSKKINIVLKVWRQKSAKEKGKFEKYHAEDIDENASFLEMLDVVNERLTLSGEEAIAFEHDCREGICGCCGAVVNGRPHGPMENTTLCQLHMRKFKNNDTIVIEPFKAKPFRVVRDLVIDRSAFDGIISSGGFISIKTGSAPDANSMAVKKQNAEMAMDAAACIGCGACVAACPNASAMLFTSAKINQLGLLPQGQPERTSRVRNMISQMEGEGFGNCSNEQECSEVCPKGIKILNIARMNWEFLKANIVT